MIDESIPRPEHPRPDFVREPWFNLNGRWRFTFDKDDVGEQLRWYRVHHPTRSEMLASTDPSNYFNTGPSAGSLVEDPFGDEIVVPFPWQSHLSGICEPDYKGAGWYQRVIVAPVTWSEDGERTGPRNARGLPGVEDTADSSTAIGAGVRWRRHPYLCFGAIDWNAKVWIDGRFVAEHDGGYSPFALDLSNYLRPGHPATLTVRAWDTAAADTTIGKQTPRWYTHSSGIWQTVWLEGRPAAHLTRIHVTPHLEEGRASFSVAIRSLAGGAGNYQLTVTSSDGLFPAVDQIVTVLGGETVAALDVLVPHPRAWSPEDPFLYECRVTLRPAGDGDQSAVPDEVATYFGLRSVSKGTWNDKPYEYVFLNGEPVYLRGALDQAFHPQGLHSYPSDEAIRGDVQAAKDLGLNMLRCHIKVNDPRYYYWCDKLGVLMMYDFPSASIYTPKARAYWEQTFRDAVERDFSHPCIFSWILFNETWGLEEHQTPASWQWVKEMYDLAKRLDPSRLVEDNSACLYDHVDTDLNTWHFYIGEYDRAKAHVERVVQQTYPGSGYNYVSSLYQHVADSAEYKQATQPLLNSEYGSVAARDGDRDVAYAFKFLTTELRRHDKICGYVYTELTDIEWEHNGFLNYDRTKKEFGYGGHFPGMTVADLNGADFVGLDCPPCYTLPPGTPFRAPVFFSHWDRRRLEQARLHWRITAVDRVGEACVVDEGKRSFKPCQYGVCDAGEIESGLPDEPCLVTVAVWVEDDRGAVRARNYVNVDAYDPAATSPVEKTPNGYALRFRPADFVDSSWPTPRLGARGAKFGASEAGWVEYAVVLPEEVKPAAAKGLRLRFEAGARTARSRIGWKDPNHVRTTDYPQTEERKLPTDLVVSINGRPIGQTRLPDDPADAHGVLSAHLSEHWEPSSYGFLTTFEVQQDAARDILEASRDRQLVIRFQVPRSGRLGGFNLYGARMGAYPLDPTVFVDL